MRGIYKGRALILCALIATVIVTILGIRDAKSIGAETPEGTSDKQVKEIVTVTVTPKKEEPTEYINFDLRHLSIVRQEGEEDERLQYSNEERNSVADAPSDGQGERPNSVGSSVTGVYEPQSGRDIGLPSEPESESGENSGLTGEPESDESNGQEQWIESEDIVSEDGDGYDTGSVDEDAGSYEDGYSDGYADESEVATGLTYLGTWTATGYCSCGLCCGEYSSGYTASGTLATEGRTIACNSLPMGTEVYIEGYGNYIVEDTGWSPYGDAWLDVYFDSHDSALAFGLRDVEVYLVN